MLTKKILYISFLCTILVTTLSAMHAKTGDDNNDLVLQEVLNNTYVKEHFVGTEYINRKTILGKAVLNELKHKENDGNETTKLQYRELNRKICAHNTAFEKYYSLSGWLWRFITRNTTSVAPILKLPLAQELLLYRIVNDVKVEGDSKSGDRYKPAAPKIIATLEQLIDRIKTKYLPDIKKIDAPQEEASMTYFVYKGYQNSAPPALPESFSSGIMDSDPTTKPSLFKSTGHCWKSFFRDGCFKISNHINNTHIEIPTFLPDFFDLSQSHIVGYEKKTNKLSVFLLPQAKKTYTIDTGGNLISDSVRDHELKTPCWTHNVSTNAECTALALCEKKTLVAQAIVGVEDKNHSILMLKQLPIAMPAVRSFFAKLCAYLPFIKKAESKKDPAITTIVPGIVKSIVPINDQYFLCLNNNNHLFRVHLAGDTLSEPVKIVFSSNVTETTSLISTISSSGLPVTHLAVDQKSDLCALMVSQQIYAINKSELCKPATNLKLAITLENPVTRYPKNIPKLQAHRGEIIAWEEANSQNPNNNATTKNYDSITKYKTQFTPK